MLYSNYIGQFKDLNYVMTNLRSVFASIFVNIFATDIVKTVFVCQIQIEIFAGQS